MRTPQDERQRNLVFKVIAVSHLVSYHLKFFVSLVFVHYVVSEENPKYFWQSATEKRPPFK